MGVLVLSRFKVLSTKAKGKLTGKMVNEIGTPPHANMSVQAQTCTHRCKHAALSNPLFKFIRPVA